MSRDMCGICWHPWDEAGHCKCPDNAPTCDECGKSKDRGWTLYCVACAERAIAPPAEKPSTESNAPHVDIEQLIADCVPGGDWCDPQVVADAIRAWDGW